MTLNFQGHMTIGFPWTISYLLLRTVLQ